MTATIEMIGKTFGRLHVVSRAPSGPGWKSKFMCRCDCGNPSLVLKDGHHLRKAKMPSCGCEKSRVARELKQKDGYSNHPFARLHKAIMRRCHSPNDANYHKYGARGIYVCEKWQDRGAFCTDALAEMGPRPSPAHSIDRIDTFRGYEPGNVRWATYKEQSRNSRRSCLDENDVVAILAMHETGRFSNGDIAEAFSVSARNIRSILMGGIWGDISGKAASGAPEASQEDAA